MLKSVMDITAQYQSMFLTSCGFKQTRYIKNLAYIFIVDKLSIIIQMKCRNDMSGCQKVKKKLKKGNRFEIFLQLHVLL